MNSFPVKMSWPLIVGLAVCARVFVPEKLLTPSALTLGLLVLVYAILQWVSSSETARTQEVRVSLGRPMVLATLVAAASILLWKHLFEVSHYVFWRKVVWSCVVLWTANTWLLMFQLLYQRRLEAELSSKKDAATGSSSLEA